MRVADLFKRLLGLPGVRVAAVELEERHPRGPTLVVHLRRPARGPMACSGCGRRVARVHDRQARRLRHLDVAGRRCELALTVRRVRCPTCGVRPETLPFARPGARFSRAFEDTCAYLTQRTPMSTVAALMRIDWATVGRIGRRILAERRGAGDGLDGLARIGVDEVSWAAGHRYLTIVCCHDSRRVVWAGAGPRGAALERFFDALGPARAGRLVAISADLGRPYLAVIGRRAPAAAICADPFHLVAQAGFALDRMRAAQWQRLRREDPAGGRWLKGARFALRRGPARRSDADRRLLARLAEANGDIFLAHLWCDQLRAALSERDPARLGGQIAELADAAEDLGHRRFAALAATPRRHSEQIENTARHNITNGRLEGLNSIVRLISHRARGFRRVDSLIGLIHLVCGRIEVALPHTNA